MKPLYTIQPETGSAGNDQLLLAEFSHYHFCFATLQKERQQIGSLYYFTATEPVTPSRMQQVLSEHLPNQHFQKAILSNAFPEASLIPAPLFKEERAANFLKSPYPPAADTLYYDTLPEQNVVIGHSLPMAFKAIFSNADAVAVYHFFTPQLKVYNGFVAADQICLHFTAKEFRVVVKKGGAVHLAQTYLYNVPLDVVYYLLVICRTYQLVQSEAAVILSGLVDADSGLYKELHHYFSNIHFAKPQQTFLADDTYPQHFFSSLYNLAACV